MPTKRKRTAHVSKAPKAKKTKNGPENEIEQDEEIKDVIMTDVQTKTDETKTEDVKLKFMIPISNRRLLQQLFINWGLGEMELLHLFILSNRFESWIYHTYKWEQMHKKCVFTFHDVRIMREIIESYRVAILNVGLIDDSNGCSEVRLTWISEYRPEQSDPRPLPDKSIMGGALRREQFCTSLRLFARWEYARRKIALEQLFLRNLLIIYLKPNLLSYSKFSWDQTEMMFE